jgi:hypothetical protein
MKLSHTPRCYRSIGLTLLSLAITATVLAQTSASNDAQDDANASSWHSTTSLESWSYITQRNIRPDSLLNPNNTIANFSHLQGVSDQRFNLRADNDQWQWVFTPRLLSQRNTSTTEGNTVNTQGTLLSTPQAFARFSTSSGALTVGRELFTWGPAQLRSPSNPFFFDTGRTNPMAAPNGIDLIRYTQSLNDWRLTAAHVFQTSQTQPAENLAHTDLLKLDYQDSNSLSSFIVAQQHMSTQTPINQTPWGSMGQFVGGFTQMTPDDAWLIYAEGGQSHAPNALQMSASPSWFSTTAPADLNRTGLVGASYTTESGLTLQTEYLHNSSGWTSAQEQLYFANAKTINAMLAAQPSMKGLLSMALAAQPRMMGRDYVWWQMSSNPQDTHQRWLINVTQNISDHSSTWVGYYEKNWVARLSSFVALNLNAGSTTTEFGSLSRGSLSVGLKWFVF